MGHEMGFYPQKKGKKILSFWIYGKVATTFFIIGSIFLIVSLIITYYQFPISLLGLLFTPILTSLIVILINIHNSKSKNEFILELLLDEIGHNLLILYENQHNLKIESQYLEDKLYTPTTSLYPLKLDIWKYSISNLGINPFNKFGGAYNSFIYEAIRYNENINFRFNMNPLIYQRNFIETRKTKNKTLLDLGESAINQLINVLRKIGHLSIINSENIKNYDDLINQLKDDGIPYEKFPIANEIVSKNLKNKDDFCIYYYYFAID